MAVTSPLRSDTQSQDTPIRIVDFAARGSRSSVACRAGSCAVIGADVSECQPEFGRALTIETIQPLRVRGGFSLERYGGTFFGLADRENAGMRMED